MVKRILIIGGYGNFGRFIAENLARESNVQLIIAGRNLAKAKVLAEKLQTKITPQTVQLDVHDNLMQALAELTPDIVIHTSGPYQSQDYFVARACIEQGCHYIDLADARDYVSNITLLDTAAKTKNILLCSGASTVPSLTSAIIDKYIGEFERLEEIAYGIATAQLTNRGLATTAAVLSYAGKPFTTLVKGQMIPVYGWLNLRWRKFWGLHSRPLGNCDIPDLELFPKRYPSLQTMRFQAGLELKLLHFTLVALAYCVRIKLLPSLQPFAPYLLKISRIFDRFGTDDSGFYMQLCGNDNHSRNCQVLFELIARHGDGLYIPSMPAVLIAQKLAREEITHSGAYPCMGFITLDEYLAALQKFAIEWRVHRTKTEQSQ